jgi:MFS family permease
MCARWLKSRLIGMTSRLPTGLKNRSFRRLAAALAASQIGDWLYNVALLTVVYERTGSPSWVALTTAARVAPIVVLGPLGGVVADRFDRRQIMVVSDLIRAGCMLGLVAVATAGLPVVVAPALAALATAAAAPYPISAAATTPRLVSDADLPGANAARSAVGMAAIAGGPLVGAVILLLGSPELAFLVNAATFVVSALAVLSIPAGPAFAPARTGERSSVVEDIVLGARTLRAHPAALRLVGADVVCSIVYGMQTVLLLVLSRSLGFGDAGYGWVLAGMGLGGVLGTGLTSRAARSAHPRRVLVLALLGVAGPAALMAATPCLPGLLVWAMCGGAGAVLVEVLCETSLQRDLDERVFARAYGIAFPAAIAGIVGGSLLAAPLVAAIGVTGALVGTGLLAGLYAAAVALPQRRVGRHRAGRIAQPVAAQPAEALAA